MSWHVLPIFRDNDLYVDFNTGLLFDYKRGFAPHVMPAAGLLLRSVSADVLCVTG